MRRNTWDVRTLSAQAKVALQSVPSRRLDFVASAEE